MSVAADLLTVAPEDVHSLYAELREADNGIHTLDAMDATLVMRYDDVFEILRKAELFSNSFFWTSHAATHDPEDLVQRRFVQTMSQMLLFQDPPAHRRLRDLVRHAFSARAIQLMEETVRRTTAEVLDRFEPRQQVAFMDDVAMLIPLRTIAGLMGVPIDDHQMFMTRARALAATVDPGCQGKDRDRAIRLGYELIVYLTELIAERRSNLGEDVLSLLIAAEEDGDRLSADELAAMVSLLLVAGHETSANLLANGLKLLLDHPEQRESLAEDPALTPTAVEEMLRLEPSFRWDFRVTTQDVELGGKEIKQGSLLFVGLASANRDPAKFTDPNGFDITRDPNHHVGFGLGIHHCLGAPLARLEGEIFFPMLFERFPDVRAGERPPVYRPDFNIRMFKSLPICM